MDEKVVCYQLGSKFVNNENQIPEKAQQVLYYSLAIGHHVGVLDCLTAVQEIPLDSYRSFLEILPAGAGRDKLSGVLKWTEIEINQSHINILVDAIETGMPLMSGIEHNWSRILLACLKQMQAEPAYYLMLRKQ